MQITHLAGHIYRVSGFPEMTGSDKQVSWAEDIRIVSMGKVIGALSARGAAQGKTLDDMMAFADKGVSIGAAVQALAGKTDAKFWVENRSNFGDSIAVIMMLRTIASALVA